MVFRIPQPLLFPDPSLAEPSGLLGVGGDLSVERMLLAYRSGIFPWYSDGQPILWWSPDPRMVLYSDRLRVPRSLAKRIRQQRYEIRMNTAFEQVVIACAEADRPDQDRTWITDEMIDAYVRLHQAGHAQSIEAWADDELVGGLYGVSVGRLFSGESMFARAPDASKIALVHAIRQLAIWDFPLVDCQVYTDHLERFGAVEIDRTRYLAAVRQLVAEPSRIGPWAFDVDFECRG